MLWGASAFANVRINPDQAVFGCGITEATALQATEATQAGCRAGEDDHSAAPAGEEMGDCGPCSVIRTIQVDGCGRLPLLEFLLDGQLAKCHRRDTRVRADDVQSTELLHAGVHRGLHLIEIANIGDGAEHLAAFGFHQGDRLVEFFAGGHRIAVGRDVGADIDADDVCAVGGQPHRMATTLTARDSGDERDLAVQTTHRSSLRCVRLRADVM